MSATVSVRMRVKATLTLTSSGGKLTARIASTSPVVRSALVTFYRVFSNGTRHVIGTAKTDSLGHATATFTYASGSTITVVAAVHDVSGVTGNWTTAVAKRV
jgi:hypothetical protein